MEQTATLCPLELAFQLQSTAALAHDKGPTPICGPAHCVPEATLQQNVQDRDFPSRRVRKKPPQADIDEFKAKCRELRRFATAQELSNPVSFALENSWTTTLKSDKLHFLEHTTLRMT